MPNRIAIAEPDYPGCLLDLEDPPAAVHVAGVLPPLERAVAIVGTRRVDVAGTRFARELASELARAGCTIVSGGALGIDTAAHEGALDVGGATIAVLPSRVDAPYPPRNHALFAQIAGTGALLAEEGELDPRYASTFLSRNRLIAALAPLTIVVQAPVRSGALSTAAHARKLGRVVMAVPFAPWEVRGEGCLGLLASGARMCRSSADVLASIAVEPLPAPPRPRVPRVRDEDEAAVLERLGAAPTTVDTLCDQTQLSAPRVQRAILMLLLAGELAEPAAGRYVRVR
ncbi:MAG TPA: DNA-processing protein DprA [Polyangiales bacterium]|nr:DNA-processing protein DprA [Polyangiales bacterium]